MKLETDARMRSGVKEAMLIGPVWVSVMRRAIIIAAKPPIWATLLILPMMVPLRSSPA